MKTQIITAAAALLVIGSSTAALAAPARIERGHGPVVHQPAGTTHAHVVREAPRATVTVRREAPRPVIVRERAHWYHAPIVVRPRIVLDAPIPVYAQPSALIGGAETISLGDNGGGAVELAANGGATWVQSALITYADGSTESVAVNQELDARNPALQLQTDGSAVASVTIYGNGTGVAAWMV